MIGILVAATLLLDGGSSLAPLLDSREVERSIMMQTASLSEERQLALYLGDYQSRDASTSRYSQEARVGRLAADPAIKAHFASIRESWFEAAMLGRRSERPLFRDVEELVQLKVMISRNLYFRNRSATPESIRAEYSRIQALRNQYRDLHIFAGREVVYAASSDKHKVGNTAEFLFGHPPTQARLRKQADRFTFFRPRSVEDKRLLEERLSSSDPLTLVFEGHGRDKALKLWGALSVAELGRRLADRQSGSVPILVLDACQSHTFSRHLFEVLDRSAKRSVFPVVITPEEYGQDFVKSVYADRFLSRDLRLGRERVQLGNLMEEAWITTSVYVPDADGVPAQIL